MKLRCYYDRAWKGYRCRVIDYEKYHINYSRYLANAMSFLDDIIYVEKLLDKIYKLENNEIEVYEYGTEIFFYDIYKDRVDFEPDFYEEWGEWSCPIEEFKRALLGWREFLKLPRSEDSYMEIEINDL